MADSERIQNPWMASEQTAIEMNADSRECSSLPHPPPLKLSNSDQLGIGARAFSAAGAAFLSAIIVNPLDVAKVPSQFFFVMELKF